MTLGRRTDYGDAKYSGLRSTEFVQDVSQAVQVRANLRGARRRCSAQTKAHRHLSHHAQDAMLCGFDFVVAPLVHPDHRPPPPAPTPDAGLPAPFSRDDVLYLASSQWVRQVRVCRAALTA